MRGLSFSRRCVILRDRNERGAFSNGDIVRTETMCVRTMRIHYNLRVFSPALGEHVLHSPAVPAQATNRETTQI